MRKNVSQFLRQYGVWVVLFFLLVTFFSPVFFGNKTLLSTNFLVSFYNPWAQEKFPGWPQGVPYKPVGIDNLRIFYPQREFTDTVLSSLQLPFWNPYSFSGNYHIGLSETGVFYPFFMLFLLLPTSSAWTILTLLEPLLAFVGMYYFLRSLIPEKVACFFGGLVFAFSGIVVVRMIEGISVGHTLIWLPFALWGIEGYLQQKKLRFLVLQLLALVASLLAGWFQFTFYLLGFVFLYSIFSLIYHKSSFTRRNMLVFLPFIVLPLVTLYHLIPAFETFLLSPREDIGSVVLGLHLMPFSHIFTLFYPDFWGNPATLSFFGKSEYKESIFYIGVIPALLAGFSLRRVKNKRVIFFALLAIFTFLLGVVSPLSALLLQVKLPLISSFLPDRILYLTSFSLAVLSAFGLAEVYRDKRIGFSKTTGFICIFVLLIIYLSHNPALFYLPLPHPLIQFLSFLYHTDPNTLPFLTAVQKTQLITQARNLLLGDIFIAGFFVVLFLRRFIGKMGIILALLFLTILGQWYFIHKYVPFSEKDFTFPQNEVFSYLENNSHYYRFITAGSGYIASDFPLLYHIYSPDGVSSMYPKRYGELVTYALDKGKGNDIPRIETRIDPDPARLFTGSNIYMERLLQIDGIKYVVVKNTDLPAFSEAMQKKWQLVWANKTWSIFTYEDVLPRFFWTNSDKVIPDNNTLLKTLFSKNLSPKTILLEKNPSIPIPQNGSGTVQLVSYGPEKISFMTNADSNGLIFLSDNYSPYFQVTIDGNKTEILRADYTFRAIAVPKGKHRVTLFYHDNLFIIGVIISLAVVLALVFSILLVLKRKIFVW